MKTLAIDFEWDIETGKFRCGSWYDGENLYGSHDYHVVDACFSDYSKQNVVVVGHNVTSDLTKMLEWGMLLPSNLTLEDSLLAARLVYPQMPTKELKPFAREFGFQWKDEHASKDVNVLLSYCGKDTYASYSILASLKEEMDESQKILFQFHSQLQVAMLVCEIAGMKVDDRLLATEITKRGIELGNMASILPAEILTNDGILRAWLIEHFTDKQLQVLPWTATHKKSVGVKGLRLLPQLKIKQEQKLFTTIQKARELQDYYSLYVERPLALVTASGFFHPRYKHLVAKTHRRSTEPAIQNWPSGARKIFISRFEGGEIVSFDYKNLEARLFAWEAGCKKFMQALIEGGYPRIAEIAFGWEKITKQDPKYTVLKSLVLAVMYNMSVGGFKYGLRVDHNIEITWQEAQNYVDRFFEKFPEIHSERERRKICVHKLGYAESYVGARLILPSAPSGLFPEDQAKWKQKHLENQAVNFPTQNIASYVTGGAMVDVVQALCRLYNIGMGEYLQWAQHSAQGHSCRVSIFPIAEVHDELVFDCAIEDVDWLILTAKDCMMNGQTLKELCPGFDCPLDVEVSVGKTWS